MDIFFGTTSITTPVAVVRLLLSFVAGGIIGLERSKKREYAGLRTHILICLGSTLLMLLSIWIPEEYLGAKNGDPGRIAAQVVSGIGAPSPPSRYSRSAAWWPDNNSPPDSISGDSDGARGDGENTPHSSRRLAASPRFGPPATVQ